MIRGEVKDENEERDGTKISLPVHLTRLREKPARPLTLLAVVLLADGQGAEHDGVGIGKLTNAAVGAADEPEGKQQLLRLWAQRRLDCWNQALHGGAGLG